MVKSKLLNRYNQIFHYFGDRQDSANLKKLGIDPKDIIYAEQIHGNKIAILKTDKNKHIKGADGLITNKPMMIGILTADCLPIFFFDPKNKIIAAIHAGWKGLLKGIIKDAITGMIKLGSDVSYLLVSVGPHIQVCCYNVSGKRIKEILKTNTSDRSNLSSYPFTQQRLNNKYLDLGKIALSQFESSGIKSFNIDVSNICTSCNTRFWSFRREKEESGRMVNIIGIKK